MARVLVIGGTAFMGRALVELLLERGDEVVIMHRGSHTPFGDRTGEIRCDRNDPAAVREKLEHEHFDIVYDNVYDFQRGTTAEQVSAAATAVIGSTRRYVFTSSVAVFGAGGEFDEDAEPLAADYPTPYSEHKAQSERALFALDREDRLNVTVIRPAYVFGPHNPFDREAFFWDRILADRPVIIPGSGRRTMQWVYSQDFARVAATAAISEAASGRAYNLGNYPPVTQLEFVQLLAGIAGKEARLVHIPREQILAAGGNLFAPPFYFGVYLDNPPITVRVDRLRADLGIELTPLEEGLRETYEWYRQQSRQSDFAWEDALLASVS